MPRRSLWLIFAVVVGSLACYQRADHNPYGRYFAEVLETIDRYYVEPVDDQKLFEGALEGMMGRLDDYSAFLPRSQTTEFQESLDQQYGGIGIEVSLEGPQKQLTVLSPLVGTPAYKAGIQAGDKIVAIDGRSTQNLQLKDIVRVLRGRPGAEVKISVARAGQDHALDFSLVRALIKVDSILGDLRQPDGTWTYMLPGDQRIGYVRINSFGEATVEEFKAAMQLLTEQKCRGVVLDMRNNPGGLLQAAQQICDLFLPRGAVIVSTRGRDAHERDRYVASGSGPFQTIPLVVLVNSKSASASEIVAACLQDHHRAAVIGERTYGKGTVQNVIPLEGGRSLLKLTIASYWRPSGKNIHRVTSSQEGDEWGVTPDPRCEVKLNDDQTAAWLEKRRQRDVLPRTSATLSTQSDTAAPLDFDPQLQRAIEVLEQQLAGSATASVK